MGPAELPVEPLPSRYGITALGAFIGGSLGGAGGLTGAAAISDRPADDAFAVIALIFVSLWAGTTLGSATALRSVRDRLASRTTLMVAAGVLTWCVVSVPSIFWALEAAPATGAGEPVAYLGLAAMLTVPPALGARWILLANEKLSKREEI